MAAKEKKTIEPLVPTGLMIYSDAGTKPNPGFSGWGIHGYLYNDEKPKKGSGNPTAFPTAKSYLDKSYKEERSQEVTILRYVDGLGTILHSTNNGAEIIATTEALRVAATHGVPKVDVLSDSMYVVKAISGGHLEGWASNGWLKPDGTEPKSLKQWQDCYEALNNLKDKNIAYNVGWVKGHNGECGNEIVDTYAVIGRIIAARGMDKNFLVTSPPEGYWEAPSEKHPFLFHPSAYLTSATAADKEGEYMVGTHEKEDDLLGSKTPDGAYAYIRLSKNDDVLETIKDRLVALSDRDDRLLILKMSGAFKKHVVTQLTRFGPDCIYPQYGRGGRKMSLYFPIDGKKDECLAEEVYPPLIAVRAIDALSCIKGVMKDYRTNPDTEIVGTDITSLLYETSAKGKQQLKPEFIVGFKALTVDGGYKTPQREGIEKIPLTFGVDIPDRNCLKRIESLKTKVTLLTWYEAGTAIRYGTLVESDDDVGLWVGFYTNLIYLK